jgi:hypothetical protein
VLAITVNGNSTATLPPSSVPYVTAAASTAVTYGTTGAMSLTAYFVQP